MRVEVVLRELNKADPVARAKHEAIELAIAKVEAALDELRALLPSGPARRRKRP